MGLSILASSRHYKLRDTFFFTEAIKYGIGLELKNLIFRQKVINGKF
jgi:hypothetical protein